MRILFIGEYSRLHNSLKEALTKMGHEVMIVGNGDGFKDLPVDFNIDAKCSKSKIPNLFRQAIYRIFKYDVAEWEYGLRFQALLPKLKDFDVVQLISETPLFTFLPLEFQLLKKLRKQNRKMFMLTSGTDVTFMQAAINKKFRYSLLDPYLKNKKLIDEYRHALPHLEPKYKKHHKKMLGLVNGIIASDIDYAIALEGEPKSLGLIGNPVNTDKIVFEPHDISGPISIFHGINRWNYHKKGNAFFEKALKIICEKYGDKVNIVNSENIPYDDYIKLYDASHILLDQVYAYDQGYNALEAMAKGKVVFTGAEKEFNDYYNLDERVAVNALPDVNEIVRELSFLIENPQEISAIGKRARTFIEREHDYMKVAEKYLQTWQEH
jgi:glycosyltransferase involved in cell wall biosynthesis